MAIYAFPDLTDKVDLIQRLRKLQQLEILKKNTELFDHIEFVIVLMKEEMSKRLKEWARIIVSQEKVEFKFE